MSCARQDCTGCCNKPANRTGRARQQARAWPNNSRKIRVNAGGCVEMRVMLRGGCASCCGAGKNAGRVRQVAVVVHAAADLARNRARFALHEVSARAV